MGLFDRFKREKQDSSKTDEIEKLKAKADKEYAETMAYFAKQDAERESQIKKAEDFNNEIMGRISQLNNAPGARKANEVAHAEAKEFLKQMKESRDKKEKQETKEIDNLTPENIVETELIKLGEKGIPKETLEEFRKSDLDFIKNSRGIASERTIISRLKETYGRFDDQNVVNIYKLNAEEYLQEMLFELAKQGFTEEKIKEFHNQTLSKINQNRRLKSERQINIPERNMNLDTFRSYQLFIKNNMQVEQQYSDNSMKR